MSDYLSLVVGSAEADLAQPPRWLKGVQTRLANLAAERAREAADPSYKSPKLGALRANIAKQHQARRQRNAARRVTTAKAILAAVRKGAYFPPKQLRDAHAVVAAVKARRPIPMSPDAVHMRATRIRRSGPSAEPLPLGVELNTPQPYRSPRKRREPIQAWLPEPKAAEPVLRNPFDPAGGVFAVAAAVPAPDTESRPDPELGLARAEAKALVREARVAIQCGPVALDPERMTPKGIKPAAMRQLVGRAIKAGATIRSTGGGHYALRLPDGTPIFLASTTSDQRAIQNVRSLLRRKGMAA